MSRAVLSAVAFAAISLTACKKDPAPVAATPPAAATNAAAVAAPAEITFGKKGPVTGAKFANVNSMKMDFEIVGSVDGKEIKSSSSSNESSKYTVEYLATEGGSVTRGKISYTEKKTIDVEDGETKETVKPVVGKSYVVEQQGENVLVKPASGEGDVTDEETAAVAEDSEFLGTDPIREAIPARAIKVGEVVPELKVAIQSIIAESQGKSGDKTSLDGVTGTLTGERGDVGIFSIALTMKSTDEGMASTVELKGSLEVRKSDSAMMMLKLEGPMTLKKVDESAGKLAGKGTMSITLGQQAL